MSTTKWLRLAYYEIFQVSQALDRELEINQNDSRIRMLRMQCSNIEATLFTKLTQEEREQALAEGENATD